MASARREIKPSSQPDPLERERAMRVSRWHFLGLGTLIVGCASAGTTPNVRVPYGAVLLSNAKTGPTVPLRIDPNARVVIATYPNLAAASYSDAQATRGEAVYEATCANCHQADKFIGSAFVDAWNNRRVGDFYTLIRSSMPVDNPGGLKDQEYLDVVAYLIKANHGAHTMDSLSADTAALRTHKISVSAR
jgi:mono/diheme cytochrome c family protein